MPTVLLIDDDPAILEGMSLILGRAGYATVLAASGVEGLDAARDGGIDVVVTDLAMPGLSGLELIKLLQRLDPALPVVVLTGNATLGTAVAAMRHAGAFDFIEKPVTDPAVLELAIAEAFVHREHLRAMRGGAAAPESQQAAEKLARLNERERELLALLAEGLSNQQIAEAACLGPTTVRNYLSRLYEKLEVENRTQAVLLLGQSRR